MDYFEKADPIIIVPKEDRDYPPEAVKPIKTNDKEIPADEIPQLLDKYDLIQED